MPAVLTFIPREAVFGVPPWPSKPDWAQYARSMNAGDPDLTGVVVGPTGAVVQYVWKGEVLEPGVAVLHHPDLLPDVQGVLDAEQPPERSFAGKLPGRPRSAHR